MTEVRFPPMSQEQPDAVGVVATWYVADGEAVAVDQVLADVQVDKVAAEVPAPVAGTIRLRVQEEQEVTQGDVIAVIE
jgi:pyruvate/2-oxoglutarate dehydrogenase complex dihydrolipoamide acyltransferase (E2) component